MSRVARVAAQAKVNLLLRVLAREESGYHAIETLFLRITLADDVVVRVGDEVRGRSLDCTGKVIPPEGLGLAEQNLAYRAACAYHEATSWPESFAIEITKQIPVGAGLGGGSADAGAVLRALDALSPNPVGRGLIEIAGALGADVPFMTLDSPMALAWGRGDRVFPLRALASRPIVILMPAFPISTKDAYAWLAHDRGTYEPRSTVIQPAEVDTWENIAAVAMNEFEPVVTRRHPEITAYIDALRTSGALPAMLSGSGSAVFGVYATPTAAVDGSMAAIQAVPGMSARGLAVWTAERVERVDTDS
jgi:4-diphosphocytidyl-2-C-methyl-D-erythritol kinase